MYTLTNFTHNQAHQRRICNSPHISGPRDITLNTVITHKAPHLEFIQQVAMHSAYVIAVIHIENYSIGYVSWLMDSRWAILEDKNQSKMR